MKHINIIFSFIMLLTSIETLADEKEAPINDEKEPSYPIVISSGGCVPFPDCVDVESTHLLQALKLQLPLKNTGK